MNASDSDSATPNPTPDAEAPPGSSSSLWARLFNVYAAPGEVFDEVKAGPPCTTNWLVPMLLLVVVGALGAWLVYSQPAIQQQQDEAQAKLVQRLVEKGKLPAESATAAPEPSRSGGSLKYTLGPIAWVVVTSVAAPFWGALLLWLIGAKLLKGGFSYLKAVEAAGLSCMVDVLGAVVRTLLILALVDVSASVSPALLVKEFDWLKPAHLALAFLDLFTLWLYALRALAMARLGHLRLGVCLAWMLGVWAGLSALILGVAAAVRAVIGL